MALLLVLLPLASQAAILESPSSLTVSPGSPATLACRSSEPGEAVWFRAGRRLPPSHQRISLPDNSLFFLSARPEDSGVYHCSVAGANSKPATLTVGKPPVHSETEQREKLKEEEKRIVMTLETTTITKESSESQKPSESNSIPLVFWIICLSIVSFMTMLVIFGAAFVFVKIRQIKQRKCDNIDIESEGNLYEKPMFSSKRLSWVESPWSFYPSTQQFRSFKTGESRTVKEQQRPGGAECEYDYASSDYFLLSQLSNDSSNSGQNPGSSNHYACANIHSEHTRLAS